MPSYKNCMVPNCVNTTSITPNKLYFRVPKDAKTRAEWCKIMKRNDITLTDKSVRYCCEDHFDFRSKLHPRVFYKCQNGLYFFINIFIYYIETDMKNYTKYKMKGGFLKLKNGVVPHKFDCQKKQNNIILVKLSTNKKQKQIELFEKALNTKINPENILEVPVEFIKCEPTNTDETDSIGGTNIDKSNEQ